MSTHPLPLPAAAAILLGLALVAGPARADWLQPDPSFRDAQMELRLAARDTVGQAASPARLDTLAVALLRLARLDEARALFERVLALSPGDEAAAAGLGKIALFRGRPARAESLLAPVAARVPGAAADLYAARLRLGRWSEAAELAEGAGEPGRAALLRRLAEGEGPYRIQGPERVRLLFSRTQPLPLIKAKLNGRSVLLAVDTGIADLLVDQAAAAAAKVQVFPEQTPVFWSGRRVAVKNALVQRLELGGLRIETLPAGVLSLRRWSLETNPQGETVAGIIGLNLLRRFTVVLDLRKNQLELARPAGPVPSAAGALRVPFELWGECEPMVYGSLNGARRMALLLASGIPDCGVGAPQEVFDEVGVKPGSISRAVRGAGGIIGGRAWAACSVPTVAVGPIVKEKLRGWSGAFDSSELWRWGPRRDALLSVEFLRGRRVTFDWEAQELVVE